MTRSHRAAMTGNGEEGACGRGVPRRSFFVTGLAGALLAACSAASPEPGAPLSPPVALAAPAEPPALHPAALRLVLPKGVVGWSAAELVALLGAPDFRRVEPPAELWQYRSADCVLDLFLYAEKGAMRVVHSETRERGAAAAAASCGDSQAVLRARRDESPL
jgi:hypothetical protein